MDKIHAYGGADLVYGYGGADFLYGGNEQLWLTGCRAAPADDRLLGQEGHDALYGERGNDEELLSKPAPGSEVHHRVYKMVGMEALLGA